MLVKRDGGNVAELITVTVAFAVINVTSWLLQQPLPYEHLAPFDGVYYYDVAEQITHGESPQSSGPFVYRIGTMFLVALFFEGNLLFGFEMINLVANVVTVILLVYWLRLYLSDWRIRVLLVLLFLTQWHGPVRYLYYDSAFVDFWMFAFLLLGLILIHKIRVSPSLLKVLSLGLVSFVGVIFREVVLVIPLALLFATNPVVMRGKIFSTLSSLHELRASFRMPPLTFFVPLVLGLLGLLTTHLVVSQEGEYSFVRAVYYWAYEKPLLSYLHAWFVAFGPILVLALYDWRRLVSFLRYSQFMVVYFVVFAALGWIGGSDTERILYWSMPVVYLLIGRSMEDNLDLLRSWALVAVLVVSQLLSQRVVWTLPDYPSDYATPWPILSIPSSRFQLLDLWTMSGDRVIETISLAEYSLLCALLLWWFGYRTKHLEKERL